jgi:RNA recognition motif-containing protein
MASVTEAQYLSDFNVPANPAPLNDVEQALDMASQTSAVVQSMPFFVPQAPPAPEPAPSPAKVHPHSYSNSAVNPPFTGGYGAPPPPSQPIPSTSGVATAEVVQSLGLPMFLVGQNVQALQTLASTPSLLSTFVDGNGMYDQARLTSLVHTLTQNITPSQQQAPSMSHLGNGGGYQQPASAPAYGSGGMQQQPFHSGGGGGGVYGPASSHYGQGQEGQKAYGGGGSGSWGQQGGGAMKSGYRGDQNNGDGNLHLSNYGPTTTQADIITLFQPYVHVDEVVMKGTFCFVNSSDPVGAKRAREALTGALLGGAPVRINMAQRKNRDGAANAGGFRNNNTSSFYGNTGASNMNPIGAMGRGNAPGMPPPKPIHGTPSGMHGAPPGGDDLANVRDDRGNPATKNLFVAGYGQGTSEQQIRELFSQYANIIGIIMKGTFSFVNTSDKRAAIQAREGLSGSSMNGGVLRINFAKETGRLGTSFDLTYRGGAAGGAGGGFRGGGGESHYGRNF